MKETNPHRLMAEGTVDVNRTTTIREEQPRGTTPVSAEGGAARSRVTWPLLEAVEREDVAMVQLLLDHGARSLRPRPARRRSELHALALRQNPEACSVPSPTGGIWDWWFRSRPDPMKLWQLLITAGADVEQ